MKKHLCSCTSVHFRRLMQIRIDSLETGIIIDHCRAHALMIGLCGIL